ncbi:hypothetical protein DFH08DRAFT_805774 [Mycena albidolilacea]|uniref:Uncharacterized protein n=1 Tax=Mycena albidolilacea TaxID=1033008 RepID=A0AAD7EX63_9AGAR|nr:hypothetical protein DFH08DRAFT_805774 [Mycena albidolilacea]
MAQNLLTATNAATSQQEMAALVSKVTVLSKLALDMTRLCIEVNDNLPAVVQSQVATATAAVTPPSPKWYHSPTPSLDKMDTMFPSSYLDNIQCQDVDDQVHNVPGQLQRRKDNGQEALLFYCNQFHTGECERVSEVQPASHVAAPTTTPGTSRSSAFLHSTNPSCGHSHTSSYTRSHFEVEVDESHKRQILETGPSLDPHITYCYVPLATTPGQETLKRLILRVMPLPQANSVLTFHTKARTHHRLFSKRLIFVIFVNQGMKHGDQELNMLYPSDGPKISDFMLSLLLERCRWRYGGGRDFMTTLGPDLVIATVPPVFDKITQDVVDGKIITHSKQKSQKVDFCFCNSNSAVLIADQPGRWLCSTINLPTVSHRGVKRTEIEVAEAEWKQKS